MTDYTLIALESNLVDLKIVREYLQDVMREESDFIISCLETGMIVMEETKSETAKVTTQKQSIGAKMANAIKAFFEKIKGLFRTKAVEQAKKHVDWLEKNTELIKKNANKMTIGVLPYWKGNPSECDRIIRATVDNAVRNIQNKKFSHDYATKIVDTKHVTDKNVAEYIKNFYRIGERNQLKISQETVSGKELGNKVEGMLRYTAAYASTQVPVVNKLSDHIVKALDKIGGSPVKTTSNPTGFSISRESYLSVEGCYVSESDLVTCMNYTSVLEKEEPTKPEEKEKTQVTDTNGETTSPTTVNVEPKDQDTSKGKTQKQNQEQSAEEVQFVNEVTSFIKLLFSAFTTVLEERFITYVNILRAIGNSRNMEIEDEGGEGSTEQPQQEENSTSSSESKGNGRVRRVVNKVKGALTQNSKKSKDNERSANSRRAK